MNNFLNLVTSNEDKLREFQNILGSHFSIHQINIDLPELQSNSIEYVATQKCLVAFNQIKESVIIEDTSLGFASMGGLPGPYVKWFMKKIGPEGLFKMLSGFENSLATASCIIAYMNKNLKSPVLFTGRIDGNIVFPKGNTNFGWDCIFQPLGYELTFAELSDNEKNKISHRKKAIDTMMSYFGL